MLALTPRTILTCLTSAASKISFSFPYNELVSLFFVVVAIELLLTERSLACWRQHEGMRVEGVL